jgi:hypothetical protein
MRQLVLTHMKERWCSRIGDAGVDLNLMQVDCHEEIVLTYHLLSTVVEDPPAHSFSIHNAPSFSSPIVVVCCWNKNGRDEEGLGFPLGGVGRNRYESIV